MTSIRNLLWIMIMGLASSAPVMASSTLIDGVVADNASAQIMVMLPEGGIAAHRADDGTRLWQSAAADRPLTIEGDVLVAQRIDEQRRNVLVLVGLGVADGGLRFEKELALPEGVEALLDEGLGKQFQITRDESAAGLVLVWQWRERLVQGALLDEQEQAQPTVLGGAVSVEMNARALNDLGPRDDLDAVFMALPQKYPEQPVSGVQGDQFASRVSGDVLVSKVANDGAFDRYRWQLFNADGTELGGFDAPRAWAPFTTFDSGALVLLSEPHERRIEGSLQGFARRVMGVDLSSGQVRWEVEIRDTAYRGPWPA